MKSSNAIRILSLLFLFLINHRSWAQNEAGDTPAECQRLIDKGKAAGDKGNPSKALEYYTQAEVLAKNLNLQDKLYVVAMDIGNIYSNFSNYGEALGYYRKALVIAEKSEDIDKLPRVLTNIGVLYNNENDVKKALEYYMRADSLVVAKKLVSTRPLIAINIAVIYIEIENTKEARKYLLEVKDTPKSDYVENLWKINYAKTLAAEGQLSEAEKMVLAIIDDVEKKKSDGCYTCITGVLSDIYDRQDRLDLAISYAKKGLASAEMIDKIEIYDQLYALYFKKKEFDISRKYKDSVFYAKDSLTVLMNTGLYESNKVKMKVQEYRNELEASQAKQSAERKLFIIGIVFCILLFLFIYRGLRNKIIKQKQEKIIAEKQQKIFTLELDNLKNNIAEKNRTLSAKALYLSGRNELIEEVINALGQLPQITRNKEVFEYMKTLKSYLKTDAEWEDFITYFEQVNPEFLKTLKTKYSDLSTSDIRFICYVFMNLDTREIGNIFNITYNASRKRKIRIKEKMGIDNDDSLYEYLLQIANP
jgi:Flp pilus assembly protein TadD